jgi:hypothetical protein
VGRPGPKPRLRNPSPVEHQFVSKSGNLEVASTEWIYGSDLDPDELKLRAFFKARSPQLKQQPGETLSKAVRRIRDLAAVALDHCYAATWSDRKITRFVPPPRPYAKAPWSRFHAKKHLGPTPPKKRPANGCLWLDTSDPKRPLRTYSTKTKVWVTTIADTSSWGSPATIFDSMMRATGEYYERWRLDIDYAIRRMLACQMGRIGRNGKPSYLAAAILADLLGETIPRIADFLNHYRRR